MKALFVYLNYTDTFWSFKHAPKFISKTDEHPPLGLLNIASMLPRRIAKRLIEGYKEVLTGVYSLKIYYESVRAFLKEYKPLEKRKRYFHLWPIRYNLNYLDAPFKNLVILGIKNRAWNM